MIGPGSKPIQYVWRQTTAQDVHTSRVQCSMQSWDANIRRGVLAEREGGAAQEIYKTYKAKTRKPERNKCK